MYSCVLKMYLAPEKLVRKPYDGFATDIWSIQAVLYTMAYGHLPFEGICLEMVGEQVAQPLPPYKLEVSENCQDLLQKILCYNPGERKTLTSIIEHLWMQE